MSFQQLGIDPWLVEQLSKVSIQKPTEIQVNTIKAILEGRDVIASARTGSGKTLAFCLPILQKLAIDPFGIYALVLTPTRELAFQIAEQFRIIGTTIGLKVSVVVGGMNMTQQSLELAQRPHIVIATPGRLVDHIWSSQLTFKRLRFLVLDEADRLLDSTFASNLETILTNIPQKRQSLLFSATMTEEIENLEFKSQKPFIYSCDRFDTNDGCDQKYLFIPSTVREAYLSFMLMNDFAEKSVIIFAGKPKTCEILRIMLKEQGVRSTCLHSHMPQSDRIGSLAKFKDGIVPILICTDVGSRGLDIPLVQVVINYQLPADPTDYIHRIGRTARAGRGGLSISVVTERDVEIVKMIEEKTSISC
jgi:ATP-dependent RNA helicase DDX49/DBP8